MKTKHILVVDDEQDMLEILTLILTQHGYEVAACQNGPQAIKEQKKSKADLILMDVRMPEQDGWETLKKMNKLKLLTHTPVIMVTVEKGPGVEIFGLQDMVVDYINKPFEQGDLVLRIRKALKDDD